MPILQRGQELAVVPVISSFLCSELTLEKVPRLQCKDTAPFCFSDIPATIDICGAMLNTIQ